LLPFGQLLGSQGWAKTGATLPDNRQGIIPHAAADTIVRGPATCLVPDGGRAIGLQPLQQSADLPRAQRQDMGRRNDRHAALDNLRRNLNPLQVALAHRNQFHPRSPASFRSGECDIPALRDQDILTLRLHAMWQPS
jgi:hypothetical protein